MSDEGEKNMSDKGDEGNQRPQDKGASAEMTEGQEKGPSSEQAPSASSQRSPRSELLAAPPPSQSYRLSKSRNENPPAFDDPNLFVPPPPRLRRASSTPGAFHGGGSTSPSQVIGVLSAMEEGSSINTVTDIPSMLPLTPQTTTGGISTLSGTAESLVTATLVETCSVDEVDDHTGAPTVSGYEGSDSQVNGADTAGIVYVHAQPLKGVCLSLSRRTLILSAVALVLGIVGLSVGLTLSSRSDTLGDSVPLPMPGDPFVDASMLPSGASIFRVQWGASSQCDSVAFAPLELSCDHSVYILLPTFSPPSTSAPPLPICARRGTMVECLQSNANTSSLQVVCLQTVGSRNSSSAYSYAASSSNLAASLAESTIDQCNKRLSSTAYFDYFGGVTATYLHVQRVCGTGELPTVHSTPPECVEGDVWALTPFDKVTSETSTTTPFLCASSDACAPETVCLANSTSQCVHALCDSSSAINMVVNQSSYCLDSSVSLPPHETLIQELIFRKENATETLDQLAVFDLFPLHTFHQVVWSESGDGRANGSDYQCRATAPLQCQTSAPTSFQVACSRGTIILLDSRQVHCNQTNITALECTAQNHSSHALLIACAGNAPQDLTAAVQEIESSAEPSTASCTDKMGSLKGDSSVKFFGGVAGVVIGVGQLCRAAGDVLSFNSTNVVYENCIDYEGAFCNYMNDCSNACTHNCSCLLLNGTAACNCPSLYNATSCTCLTEPGSECGCQFDTPRFGRVDSTVLRPDCIFNSTESRQLAGFGYMSNDLMSTSQVILGNKVQAAWEGLTASVLLGECYNTPTDPSPPDSS